MPDATLTRGQRVLGFRVREVTPIAALHLVACELEHEKTGARVMHLYCDDAENLFSVSFPTPPTDNTGVPHILEHCVLSGSGRFPVRDPFFEMIKMSPATFINAMTGWDRTYYPVASNVKQDLFNLAEVYFDAVFHPLLTEDTFKREGHYLAPAKAEEPTGALTVNGIVYNEMKAAFSAPESRLGRLAARGLFPDTAYGFESGGLPESIPDLTWEGLRGFHETFYHPSNAYFIFYGDIPTTDYLVFLKPRLERFERAQVRPEIARQPRWTTPRELVEQYPIGADEDTGEKTFIEMDWIVGDGVDAEENAAFYVLSLVLLGNDASPLKKAIVDAHLGHDLLPSGFASMGLETVFRVGIKGSERARADAFRALVLGTLGRIADGEIERELVEAAFRQSAYYYREITQMQPLMMMIRVMGTWIYGADPLAFLRMGRMLEVCRESYEADPGLFNRLIRERLIENPHCLHFVMEPDREWQARTDAAFAARMAAVRAPLSDEAVGALSAASARLRESAGKPNTPAAIATLPQLTLEDLPPKPVHVATTRETLAGGVTLLRNDVFSNGVNYLHLDFDLRGLPPRLWRCVPRYQETVAKLGAAGMNYEKMARRVAAGTGGLSCRASLAPHAQDASRPVRGMRFALRVLDEQVEEALGVLGDLLFEPDPRDAERFTDVLTQTLAGLRTRLVSGGMGTALGHAARGLDGEAYLHDLTSGLPQLALVTALHDAFDAQREEMMSGVDAIARFIRNPDRLTASFTGSDRACDAVKAALSAWVAKMPAEPIGEAPTEFEPFESARREGLAAPMQVAHCAQVIPAPHISHPDAPLLLLGLTLLQVDYMINEIRFKGNAYGAGCRYDWGDLISLGSYADPHITRTLKVFADLPAHIRKTEWTEVEVQRAIITTVKSFLRPIRPSNATGQALEHFLTGRTPALREAQYAAMLAATPAAIKRALLGALEAGWERSAICVVSSREKLEQANREMAGRELEVRDILG